MIPKAQIKRIIKSNGRILKRTVDEAVWLIQQYACRDDGMPEVVIATVLWMLGFEMNEAFCAADSIMNYERD